MRTSILIYVLISIIITQTLSHGSHNHNDRGLDNDGQTDVADHHHHDHDHNHNHVHDHDHNHHHDDHDHDHHHHHDHNHDHNLKQGSVEQLLSHHLSGITQDKNLMMIFAVVIVSLPSFPVFLVLLVFSKITASKTGNGLTLNEKYLRMMICLAVGSLTGDVFFGMMSHLIGSSSHDHSHTEKSHGGHHHEFKPEVFCIIIGILFFYAVDRKIGGHGHGHGHNHSHENLHNHGVSDKDDKEYENDPQKKNKKRNNTNTSAVLYLVADFLHNMIDGIGIGVAFSINNSLGIQTTIAVAIHEMPHEIGDFAILLKKGYSLPAILLTQFSTALGALVGGFLGIYIGNFAQDYLLGFTAGGFLYLALANMIPELLQSSNNSSLSEIILEVILALLGASLIVLSA